jgi:raffinose/stachyose/melibiose transport system permease protein
LKNRYGPKTLIVEIVVAVLAVCYCLPFYFLTSTALKPREEIFTSALLFPEHPAWENFRTVWEQGVGQAFVNSVVITLVSVIGLVVLGSMCAYVLARRTGKLSNGLFIMFMMGIIIPFQLSIVPLYAGFHAIGLAGNYQGMIILWVGAFMPLTIMLYTSFVRQLPKDYEEAARIDGAGTWRIFIRVIFPLLRPITGTVAIITGLFIWNDFFSSLIFIGGTKFQTLPVSIYSFVGQYLSKWNLVFAAILVAVVPFIIFFILVQKQMIRGFAAGMKG